MSPRDTSKPRRYPAPAATSIDPPPTPKPGERPPGVPLCATRMLYPHGPRSDALALHAQGWPTSFADGMRYVLHVEPQADDGVWCWTIPVDRLELPKLAPEQSAAPPPADDLAALETWWRSGSRGLAHMSVPALLLYALATDQDRPVAAAMVAEVRGRLRSLAVAMGEEGVAVPVDYATLQELQRHLDVALELQRRGAR